MINYSYWKINNINVFMKYYYNYLSIENPTFSMFLVNNKNLNE